VVDVIDIPAMDTDDTQENSSNLAAIVVPPVGRLVTTADPWEPYRLLDPAGVVVGAVAAYLRDLQAAGRSPATLRSYGMDLLRWFRFLWAAGMAWDRATRAEARDFCRWLLVAGKPARPHWRMQNEIQTRVRAAVAAPASAGEAYAASVRAHSETVLRSFYDFHQDAGSGPILNPFPLDRSRRGGRAHAHHNPMEPHRNQRTGLYRPTVPARIPRSIPMRSSTSCSPGFPPTGIGPWWPSTCPPAPAPLNCCRPPRAASTRGGS
jgi:hypothetical protein